MAVGDVGERLRGFPVAARSVVCAGRQASGLRHIIAGNAFREGGRIIVPAHRRAGLPALRTLPRGKTPARISQPRQTLPRPYTAEPDGMTQAVKASEVPHALDTGPLRS